MSYCRFSTDDFQCDLYCYEDCNGGWTTHVAGNRLIWETPPPPKISVVDDFMGWCKRHEEVMARIHAAPRIAIDLPHAGEMFNDDTLEEFKDRLLYLRGLGYKFPDYVLKDVEDEIAAALSFGL